MAEKRSMEQFLADAEEYRQERLCEARADLYGTPYNAVKIPAEMCERLGADKNHAYGGYRRFRHALQHDVTQILDRLLRVQDRLPKLLEYRNRPRFGYQDRTQKWYPGEAESPWGPEVEKVIRDPRNWVEWIATGQCVAFRSLPPGLIPVASTDLDDEALENYGGKGYSMSPEAEKLWEEANEMMMYGPEHSCQCGGFEVTESLSKEKD